MLTVDLMRHCWFPEADGQCSRGIHSLWQVVELVQEPWVLPVEQLGMSLLVVGLVEEDFETSRPLKGLHPVPIILRQSLEKTPVPNHPLPPMTSSAPEQLGPLLVKSSEDSLGFGVSTLERFLLCDPFEIGPLEAAG